MRRIAATLVLIGAASAIGVYFGNTADTTETFSNEPATIYKSPGKRTLTAAERREILDLARFFLLTAVTRDHPERAYPYVGELLRGGMTKKQWETGDIPVVSYPVDEARWKFEYTNEEEIGVLVAMFPEPKATVRPVVFGMTLEPHTNEKGWLITRWAPRGGGPAASSASEAGGPLGDAGFGLDEPVRRTSLWWLLTPVAILGLGLLVPVALGLRALVLSRRGRRLARSR